MCMYNIIYMHNMNNQNEYGNTENSLIYRIYSGLFSWGANFRCFRGYPLVTKFRITNIYTLEISHKRVYMRVCSNRCWLLKYLYRPGSLSRTTGL